MPTPVLPIQGHAGGSSAAGTLGLKRRRLCVKTPPPPKAVQGASPRAGSAHVVVKVLQDIKDLKDTGAIDDAEFVRLKAAALASL